MKKLVYNDSYVHIYVSNGLIGVYTNNPYIKIDKSGISGRPKPRLNQSKIMKNPTIYFPPSGYTIYLLIRSILSITDSLLARLSKTNVVVSTFSGRGQRLLD